MWLKLQFAIALVAVSAAGAVAGWGWQEPTRGAPSSGPRFEVPQGFEVEEVYPPEKSGSVLAVTFDSRGRLVFARERGPVVLLLEEDGQVREQIFTDQVQNSQGLHFDGDDLLAVGDGPERTGLYRVFDENGDGIGDRVEKLVSSSAGMAEHGPHTVFFGPDGYLYWVLGNHAGLEPTLAPLSPHRDFYEGNLLPTYLDPRGHANSIRAPGGIFVRNRLDTLDRDWELVAGGFRNQYDGAFNLLGEIFTFDSDMEWDINLPWFRPVRTNHVVPGGEYGWRSGSGKWPDYYPDSLPSMTDVGRGSPTGVAIYQHDRFPPHYFDAFFQGDWSRGRILVGFLEKAGATYVEESEEFLIGTPLNVTGMAVGPDGALYFGKGGRNTEGGIYRVVYRGEEVVSPRRDSPLDEVLTIPQPRSAWSRARIALLKQQMGTRNWERGLLREVRDPSGRGQRRIRALELLQVYGPAPDEALLTSLRQDPSWEVRAASTYYLGLHATDSARLDLVRRLSDGDAMVRRRACEALVRTGIHPAMTASFSPVESVFSLLSDPDRFVRYAARQVLLRINRNRWRPAALQLDRFPAATEALLALAQTMKGTEDHPVLLTRQAELIEDMPLDEDLLGLLRAVQLTLIQDRGVRHPRIEEPLGQALLQRFPTNSAPLNREIAVVLAYLRTPGTLDKLLREMADSGGDRAQQIHYAYCLRMFESGWNDQQRESFIAWFQRTQRERWRGGASFIGFLEGIWTDFLKSFPDAERQLAMKRLPSLSPQPTGPEDTVVPAFQRATYAETLSDQELEEYLLWDPMSYHGNPERGREAYEKAFCANCHIFGDMGQEAGPDLTDVGRRFQRKDLIEAILYPSRTISDLWAAIEVETADGASIIGVVTREDGDTLTLTTAAGFRVTLEKSEIRSRQRSDVSLMPEGLLNNLSQREIVDLFMFLERGR